ncbi:hypothetical protein FOA43_000406 [Brettanomyces nanus]|uniref:Uncharacterized protein n=1 Tax=Eeniella nana TaxID=13502 RepID=A0A875RVR7_EENNA|nr:uncharacterized protein FOA43_000406 [Brettanomyces nanus]QPG73101.1 hypothetical protein FOA43_000406 [Brettanomyces nanus]
MIFLIVASVVQAALPKSLLRQRASESDSNVILVQSDEFEPVFNRSNDRDYFMVTLLTASHAEASCDLCKSVQPLFEEIASTVGRKEPNADIFFLHIDAHENLANLKEYGIRSVPQLWIYPPFQLIYKESSDIDSTDDYDSRQIFPKNLNITSEHYAFTLSNEIPESVLELDLAMFISHICHVNIQIDKGIEMQTLVKSFVAFTIVFRLLKKKGRKVLDLLSDWRLYCGLSIILIYINMSGLNFCIQRGVPFLSRSSTGNIQLMTGGVQYQQGVEIAISIAFQVSFTLFLVVLLLSPEYLEEGNKGLAVTISVVSIFLTYNTFTTAFLAKDHGYPFNVVEMFHQKL